MGTVQQDLDKKMNLEAKLRPKIIALNKSIIEQFKVTYRETSTILDVSQFDEDINRILSDHYRDSAKDFDNNIDLPIDVEKTQDESNEILAALSAFFFVETRLSTEAISQTNQKDINQSVFQAAQDEQTAGLVGQELVLTVAALASVFATRKLNSRVGTIIMTETQNPAEAAKLTEAEILVGLTPSVSGGSAGRVVPVEKVWRSVGDSRVRPAHISADGQTRQLNQAYLIGGELLGRPGDTRLGASAANVVNCRCSSLVNEDDIIFLRRGAA